MTRCAICEDPAGPTGICDECRADPFWAGMSDEVLAEHGRRCATDIDRLQQWVEHGVSPLDHFAPDEKEIGRN